MGVWTRKYSSRSRRVRTRCCRRCRFGRCGGRRCVGCWLCVVRGKLATRDVRAMAETLGVRERAVWKWVAAAERDEAAARAPGGANPVLREVHGDRGGPGSAGAVEGQRRRRTP